MSSVLHQPQVFLKTLFVKDFRNVSSLTLDFGEGHNLFIGQNGHGKTNCLEAVALACALKPMQTLTNHDLIRFNAGHAKVMASFGGVHSLDVEIDIMPVGKKAKLNGHALRASMELTKYCPLVSFIPAELSLVSGSQSLRRRALDQAAAALFAEHAGCVRAYEKILLNRNRLLKDAAHEREMIASFTELLIKEGALLMHGRLKTIEQMSEIFSDMLKAILGPGHHARLAYCTNEQAISDHALGDVSALLKRTKDKLFAIEQRRRVTMFGPHLDDITFLINGVDAKSFASRGQTRALVFAFKLAQMVAIHRIRGFAPMIILDDIVSELDSAIKANLINTVGALKSQVFFSTTDLSTFGSKLPIDRVYTLADGDLLMT